LGGFAVAVTASYCIALGYFWFVSHRIQPTLKIRLRGVTRESFREVLGFGVWHGIVQFGNVVTFAMPPLVVGRVLGADQIVFFSIPFMLADRLRMVVVGMANTLAPIAAGTLVSGDRDQFRSLIVTGTLAAATMCLPVGAILLVFCKPFLVLWMGDEFAWSWVVYGIVMIAMFGRITQAPTLHVLLGGGRIRGLAYVQLLTAVATVVLMIVLVTHTTWHVIAVAVGVTVPLFLSHTVFLPWYAARQMSLSLPHYLLRSYLPPLLATLPGVLLALLLNRVWPPTTWSILIVEGAASLGVSTVTAWSTCLDQSIRERLMRKVGMFFHA
jgi:O-antigen/teichoic acid export membrane protein